MKRTAEYEKCSEEDESANLKECEEHGLDGAVGERPACDGTI